MSEVRTFLHSRLETLFMFRIASRQVPPVRNRSYRPRVEILEDRTLLSIFKVMNANDTGTGSLRDIIGQVNSDTGNPKVDTIDFSIPGTGPFTIALASDLPALTHAVIIDGTSQPGYAGTPLIVLDGTGDASGFGTALTLDASASTKAFHGTIKGLEFTNVGTGISVAPGSAPMTVTLSGNTITTSSGGIGIDIAGGTGAVTATLAHNHITADGAGIGIDFFQTGATGATLTANHVTAGGGGIAIDFFKVSSLTATLKNNTADGNGGGFGIDIDQVTTSANVTLDNNQAHADLGGFGISISGVGTSLTANLTNNHASSTAGGFGIDIQEGGTTSNVTLTGNTATSSKGGFAMSIDRNSAATSATVTISGNVLATQGTGFGLAIGGSSALQATVESNVFAHNEVGVSVTGAGTTAGTVDLGGGSLGSTGGNDFRSFTTATATSYAIGLFSVASNYSIDAKSNLFSVSDPTTVIADGSHDPAAGGSGTIITS
jgi:hypothetical protein